MQTWVGNTYGLRKCLEPDCGLLKSLGEVRFVDWQPMKRLVDAGST